MSVANASEATLDLLIRTIASRVVEIVRSEMGKAVQDARGVQPTLLNVKDAAVYLGRTEQAVQHLIFQRDLPVVRIGRRVHLDRRDLDSWIEKHKY
jgi:excisionase family DNA binding protein